MNWFPIFLDLAAVGIFAMLPLLPTRDLGAYFFRFHSTLALAICVLATFLVRPFMGDFPQGRAALGLAGAQLAFAILAFIQNSQLRATEGGWNRWTPALPLLAGLPILVAFAALQAPEEAVVERVGLTVHLLTSAALLGTSVVAMILGHWYLVNASLSFDLLIRSIRFLGIAWFAKSLVCVTAMMAAWGRWQLQIDGFEGMLLALRLGAGLLMTGFLGAMAFSCARRRSNQSATGILYVVVVFVLIGELVSLHLTFSSGVPA